MADLTKESRDKVLDLRKGGKIPFFCYEFVIMILSNKDEFCKKSPDWPARVVGLTGGIASGKSTVGRMLSGQNFPLIDTDRLSREVIEPKEPALEELVRAFGEKILRDDGTLDRQEMLDIILTDAKARRLVEGIIHPRVFKRMDQALRQLAASGYDLVLVEIPLLFEAGWQDLFDYIVTVVAPDSACIKRLSRRNKVSRAKALRWIATQIPQRVKAKRSDYILYNDTELDGLQIQVNRLAEVLRGLVPKAREK